MEIAKRHRKNKDIEKDEENNDYKKTINFFNKNGNPLNINQAKLDFKFLDEDPYQFVLDIAIFKYLDNNLLEVDLQPIYVRVTIKGM